MRIPPRKLIPMTIVLLAMAAAVALSFGQASGATSTRITAAGVGAVKLGRTYTSLRLAGLLGRIGPGCELSGPSARSAPLRLPLQGGVDLSPASPRRVVRITLIGGATARGIGAGATLKALRARFPKLRLDHRTDKTFAITLAHVPKGGGGPLDFAISTKTKKVTLIGVPSIAFCE